MILDNARVGAMVFLMDAEMVGSTVVSTVALMDT